MAFGDKILLIYAVTDVNKGADSALWKQCCNGTVYKYTKQ